MTSPALADLPRRGDREPPARRVGPAEALTAAAIVALLVAAAVPRLLG